MERVRDESRFPTVKFRKCDVCGQVYTGSLTGEDACPKCHAPYREADPPAAGISRSGDGNHVLFAIQGAIRKLGQLEELRSRIDAALQENVASLCFAFEGASFLNSSLINLLVKTMQTLSIRGKPTFVIAREEETLESLQMMELDRVLRILPDREAYQAAIA
jgi:hypothetical protein